MPEAPESLPDAAQHVHTTRIAVRWGDMDAGGHVNNSRFFTYFEEARVKWLRATLDGPLFVESGPVLAEASCDFKQPLLHPANLVIDVYATPPGRTSLQNVYDAALAESGEPVPVPDLGL